MPKNTSPEYFTGRQYHIGCGPGDLAPTILLCGDPARAEKVGRLLSITFEGNHREYKTFTGEYNGVPISVMATGIGTDNTDIAVIESAQCFPPEQQITFIRIGSCGAIDPTIEPGTLIISRDAFCLENTSSFYKGSVKYPKSDPDVLQALRHAAIENIIPHHVGTTCSTSSFYGGQGREVPGFPVQNPRIIHELRKKDVLNFEMETSLLFNLANYVARPKGRLRAGSVCAVYANRSRKNGFDPSLIEIAEESCIEVGLSAAVKLSKSREGASV